jgi:lactose/L-arabinose transport system ATP-binding protein
MADLELKNVRKSYDRFEVIHGANLRIEDGEFCVFVGPSGCGKSTLLRMIAGLEPITEGDIEIGGKRVNDVEPAERGIAMVFQSYALYPHMNVEQNMGFGLKMGGTAREEIARRVTLAAETLQIDQLLHRRPAQLSGGQRQRVAIGRAIMREPDVFLFDEPLSNLDAELRVATRVEIAKLHRRLGNTMIYVTHDQIEAMTLADRIVVMRSGIIEQSGKPLDLYENPDNMFVAWFLGSPRMNFISATVHAGGTARLEDGQSLPLPALQSPLDPGRPIVIGIRPEHLGEEEKDAEGAIALTVDLSEHLGSTNFIHARGPAGEVVIVEQRKLTAHADTILARYRLESIRVFDPETGYRLR